MGIFSRIKALLEIQARLADFQKAVTEYRKRGNMLSLLQTLKSRTVWTAIAGLAFNAWNQASGHVDPTIANIVNTAIALGVSIFRAFPKQGNNPS